MSLNRLNSPNSDRLYTTYLPHPKSTFAPLGFPQRTGDLSWTTTVFAFNVHRYGKWFPSNSVAS